MKMLALLSACRRVWLRLVPNATERERCETSERPRADFQRRRGHCWMDAAAMRLAETERRTYRKYTDRWLCVQEEASTDPKSFPSGAFTAGLSTCVQGHLRTALEGGRKFCFTALQLVCPEASELTVQSSQNHRVIDDTLGHSIFLPPIALLWNKEGVYFSRPRSTSISGCS